MSTQTSPQRVLITGAAGRVAGVVLPALSGHRIRLFDRVAPTASTGPPEGAEVVLGDVTDRAAVDAACRDVDTVVHLAADPSAQASWADLRGPNVDGLERVLYAAVEAGARRVVLASSVHAAGAYVMAGMADRPVPGIVESVDPLPVDPDRPSFPCCRYGATKALAEALGRTYAYRTGISVLCLRFGGVAEAPHTRGGAAAWIGFDDTRQLVRRAIEAPASLTYGVYHGVSLPGKDEWDLGNAERDLGYVPTCDEPAGLDRDDHRWLCGPPTVGMSTPFVPEAESAPEAN